MPGSEDHQRQKGQIYQCQIHHAALDLKGEDGGAAVGEVLLIQGMVGMAGREGWLTFSTWGWPERYSTTFLVFSTWRSSRRDSVSTP